MSKQWVRDLAFTSCSGNATLYLADGRIQRCLPPGVLEVRDYFDHNFVFLPASVAVGEVAAEESTDSSGVGE
jgi:hypothetical protein